MHNILETLVRGVGNAADQVTLIRALRGALDKMFAQPALVFAIPGYERQAKELVDASEGRLELGQIERKRHKDGKGWACFSVDVRERTVIVVGATFTDTEQMEMYKTGFAAVQYGCEKLTWFITYHGDARQERAQREGEFVDGLYCSAMFTAVPKAPRGNNVVLADIHADAITGMFQGGGVFARNIPLSTILLDQVVPTLKAPAGVASLTPDWGVAAPDASRGKLVQKYAEKKKLPLAIANKNRTFDGVEHAGLIGEVDGLNFVMSDDMLVSGDSACGAAKMLRDRGALSIVGVFTHCVAPTNPKTGKSYLYDVMENGIFSHIHVTDSLHQAYELQAQYPERMTVHALAPHAVPFLVG